MCHRERERERERERHSENDKKGKVAKKTGEEGDKQREKVWTQQEVEEDEYFYF